ncbi:Retrovirus-related Pol polyprotein from transposon RE2 [Vitis vinifera]|uniref:Retrovirus-related Pol polyprotein from transposon RE2 n=1 Tax=Vitis vinifera TaxID=29760 RepID=A0A438D5Q3_VITVI|nr:Retrovirus-related Pol polyprotein from transposon RE2 [Vitis vinifera]
MVSSLHSQFAIKDLGILNYFLGVEGTTSFGLSFHSSLDLQLTAYANADWAGCPDDRRIEYKALANVASELQWIQHLLQELSISSSFSPILFCDNLSTTFLATNLIFHSQVKHDIPTLGSLAWYSKEFRNVLNPPCEIFASCLPNVISSSFQLQIVHGLKRWILDFLSFEWYIECRKWTSGSALKVQRKTAAVFFTLFSSSPLLVLVFPLEIQACNRPKSLLNSPK